MQVLSSFFYHWKLSNSFKKILTQDICLIDRTESFPTESLLSCKHSLMLFNFSLALTFSAEIISCGLALPINLTILASFLFSLDHIYLFHWPSLDFFFNWDSLHARLNWHYEAWSYKKKKRKKIKSIQKICLERT